MEIDVERPYWPHMSKQALTTRLSNQLNGQIDLIKVRLFSQSIFDLLLPLWIHEIFVEIVNISGSSAVWQRTRLGAERTRVQIPSPRQKGPSRRRCYGSQPFRFNSGVPVVG